MARFNIGKLTRQFQRDFFRGPFKRPVQEVVNDPSSLFNLATPQNVLVLLDGLSNFTDEVEKEMWRQELTKVPILAEKKERMRREIAAWRARLREYWEVTNRAAPSRDRVAIFEPVTMPLLIGLYPGVKEQRPIDAVTPFMLANQLKIEKDWRVERTRLFFTEMGNKAAGMSQRFAQAADNAFEFVTSKKALSGLAIGAGAVLALMIFRRRRR